MNLLIKQRFAVIGNPIAHSQSPQIHTAFARQCGVELSYERLLSTDEQFATYVQQFFASGGRGLNVTVPFKEHAYALCDQRSERAQAARAVNTLWVDQGQLWGDNTDGAGLVDALAYLRWPVRGARIAMLGAGGAARGVLLPLLHAGAGQIIIANRTLAKAEQLVQDFVGETPLGQQLQAMPLNALTGHFDVLINATSSSLSGTLLNLSSHLQFQYAYEMAYAKPSPFLTYAQQINAHTADGWSMLVCQAAEAFYQWHGIKPQIDELLAATPNE